MKSLLEFIRDVFYTFRTKEFWLFKPDLHEEPRIFQPGGLVPKDPTKGTTIVNHLAHAVTQLKLDKKFDDNWDS
jgi:hypothetical protein